MKKFICAILTSALLLTSMIPAFAADETVRVSESALEDIMQSFSENMPEDPAKRIRIWKVFKAYMLDGTNGIDTIIESLEGTTSLPEDSDMQRIFNRYVESVKGEYGDEFIFFLKLYRETSRSDRQTALDNFGSDADLGEEIVKTPLELDEEQAAAAEALFGSYVSDDAQAGFDVHAIDVANFLNLITPFKDCFLMTEDKHGDFVLADYDESYAEALADNMAYDKINGETIDGDTDEEEGFDILTGVVALFNTFDEDQIENLKIVLAHEDIELYDEDADEAEDPADEGSGKHTSSTGSNKRPTTSNVDKGFKVEEPTYDTSRALFNDVDADSWAVPYIMNMSERRIFIGYEDGSFKPNVGITRQEIAVAMIRALGYEADAGMAAGSSTGFADNDAIAEWARGAVNLAVEMGIFTGYDDGEFKPNKTISRQELMAVVMRLAEDTTTSASMNYADAGDIHGYAKDYVGKATTLGMINGYPDGTFQPLNDITRAEAAKILYTAFEYYDYLNK